MAPSHDNQRRHGGPGARIVELALLIGLPIAAHFVVPVVTVVPKPYGYAGILLMLAGAGLNQWASSTFRRRGTGFTLAGGGSALVATGPFAYTRNPMYLGMILWLLGLAALLGSLTPFFFPLMIFALAHSIFVPLEEERMAATFGDDYAAYRQRVRRWL